MLPGVRGESPLLHCTRAANDVGSICNSVIVALVGAGEYGFRMALLAVKKLVRSVSETEIDCEVRSDSVRATSVTLRSTATPEEISTVPKNITSMTGTITANSVSAMPRQSSSMSRAERRNRNHIADIFSITLSTRRKGQGKARCET